MKIDHKKEFVTSSCKAGTLLFIADFVNGSQDILDVACELAERQNADLQLLHVIDPEHTHSTPDAQAGTQFNLDILAQRARALKRSAVSLLSFGRPETVIPKRAAEANASVVVLPLNRSASDRFQKKLVRHLRGKRDCPVLAVPRDIFLNADANSLSIRGFLSLVRQVCEGDRQSMRGLVRASESRSEAPLMTIPKSAYFLRRSVLSEKCVDGN